MWVLSLKKLWGEVDGRIEGIVAGLSRLVMGIPKKKGGGGACLPHSARSRAVLAGRVLILGAQFFVDVLCRGGKPQRGRRIVLKIDHIITYAIAGLVSSVLANEHCSLPTSLRKPNACSPSGFTAPSGWQRISAGPVSWLVATEIWPRSLPLPERAVESLGEHALGFQMLLGKQGLVFVGEDRCDEVSDGVGVGRHLSKGPNYYWSDRSAFLAVLVEFSLEWARVAWCCVLLQVEFPCLLVVLPVDLLLTSR
jgi:hypothetical protein